MSAASNVHYVLVMSRALEIGREDEVQFQRSKSKFKTSSESNGSEVGWVAVC